MLVDYINPQNQVKYYRQTHGIKWKMQWNRQKHLRIVMYIQQDLSKQTMRPLVLSDVITKRQRIKAISAVVTRVGLGVLNTFYSSTLHPRIYVYPKHDYVLTNIF